MPVRRCGLGLWMFLWYRVSRGGGQSLVERIMHDLVECLGAPMRSIYHPTCSTAGICSIHTHW